MLLKVIHVGQDLFLVVCCGEFNEDQLVELLPQVMKTIKWRGAVYIHKKRRSMMGSQCIFLFPKVAHGVWVCAHGNRGVSDRGIQEASRSWAL